MSFKRVLEPLKIFRGDELTEALIAIGFGFGGKPSTHSINIEDALISASIEGCLKPDYRLMSLLVDWIDVHAHAINVDRIGRTIINQEDEKVRAFWIAIAAWKKKDPRWKKIAKLHSGSRIALLEQGTEFLVSKHGEDERFKDTCLLVPKTTLRQRTEDIFSVERLAARHSGYYFRVLLGPTYRADMWAHLKTNQEATPTELARIAYGNFATAWKTKWEWSVLSAYGTAKSGFDILSAD